MIKASIGPISSIELEKMYKENLINLTTEVRIIDLFCINKNTNPNFEYFKLKEYDEKIIDSLIPSNLIKKSLIENNLYKISVSTNSLREFEDFNIIKKNNNELNKVSSTNPSKFDVLREGANANSNKNEIYQAPANPVNLFNKKNITTTNQPIRTINMPGLYRMNVSPKKDERLDTSSSKN